MEWGEQDLSININIFLVGLLFVKIEKQIKNFDFSVFHLLVATSKTQQFKP